VPPGCPVPETRLNRDVAVPLLSSAPPFPLSFPPDLPHRCRGHSGPASEPPWRILAARAQGVAARWEWHEHFHAVLPPPSRSRAKRREHPVIAVTTSFTVLAGPSSQAETYAMFTAWGPRSWCLRGRWIYVYMASPHIDSRDLIVGVDACVGGTAECSPMVSKDAPRYWLGSCNPRSSEASGDTSVCV